MLKKKVVNKKLLIRLNQTAKVGKIAEKKFQNRTRIRVYGFHGWQKLQPYFLIGEDH